MSIQWRAAHRALHPFVIGFVERADASMTGASLELPFSIPVIHIALGEALAPRVVISSGMKVARSVPPRSALPTFVIALGFSGVTLFSHTPACTAVDRFIDIDDEFWRLRARLCDAPDFVSRAAIAEQNLLERIEGAKPTVSPLLKAADAIAHDRWTGPIHELARHCGIEERTLRNRFRCDLGWSPKQLLRVARFNRALRALHPRPWAGRPAQDVRLEFFDDAHFYHEFRALAGISPAAFVAAKHRSGDTSLHSVLLDCLR
jgi:AraC-like DNA-binding protein